MKAFLLSSTLMFIGFLCQAQDSQVNTLPPGKYETVFRNLPTKWELGDIILLPDNKYKMSTSDEIGDYKFSISAQRVFFTSGPLKSLYARTALNNDTPVIVLPVSENAQYGQKIPSEIWGLYRH
jgi:hypothetical protein